MIRQNSLDIAKALDITNTIYELKPYNRANLRKGVRQIINYNAKLGGSYKMMIVFY